MDDPKLGLALLLEKGGQRSGETFEFSQHIWYYRDTHSYLVVRITAFFDLFTFHTYSATALFFAVFSFSGLWAFYLALVSKYGSKNPWIAVSILFIPSAIFWGSGILKDTITLGALGWLVYACIHIIEKRERGTKFWIIAFLSGYLIFSIKVYIIICFVPIIFIWVYWKNIRKLKNTITKVIVAPLLLAVFGLIGFFSMLQISSESQRYSIDTIAERAAITAYDIRYGWGARVEGQGGYDLGLIDGSWQSMIKLMPAAINVSLYRPYLWEARNPLMLLTALESLLIFVLTVFTLISGKWKEVFDDPFLIFCLVFSLLFAFAVGVSTYNFGTLMRYKIPLVPFYMLVLVANFRSART